MRRVSSQPLLRPVASQRPDTWPALLVPCAFLAAVLASGCASIPADKPLAHPNSARISVVPSAIEFKSVVVGQKNSQTLKITNSGSTAISLQSLKISGAGFALSPVKSPVLLAPGKQASLSIVFAPSSNAQIAGSLIIASSDLKIPVTVPLSGSGEKAAPALSVSPSSINFGTRSVKSSTSQSITLKNTGNIAVSIGSISLPSSSFSVSGLTNGVSLAPDQKLEFQVWFHPTAAGSLSTAVAIATAALPAPLKIALSGSANTATQPSTAPAHSVSLDWNASTSSVAGYHVYRSNSSGGPFNRISGSLIGALNFRDTSVEAGAQYFYVVTAVESSGLESAFSNEVAAVVPDP
jgi:hypothetical protein